MVEPLCSTCKNALYSRKKNVSDRKEKEDRGTVAAVGPLNSPQEQRCVEVKAVTGEASG